MLIFREIFSIFFDNNEKQIEIIPASKIQEYQKELSEIFFDEIFVGTKYVDIKNILERYKFYSDRHYSEEFVKIFEKIFVEQLSKFVEENVDQWGIVSVPMHWTRYFIRGFDHMKLLGKKLSKQIKIPYYSILGTHFTKRQIGLSREKRIKNRENVYFVKKNIKIPENVILIDDVISTASSINMCAKILKQAGVKKIIVMTLATNK